MDMLNKIKIKIPFATPPDFDGKGDVETFIKNFDRSARINLWSEDLKKRFLPLYLQKSALTLYENEIELNEDNFSWEDIKRILRRSFSYIGEDDKNRWEMESRRQGDSETAEEYFQAKIYLINKFDKEMPESTKVKKIILGLKPEYIERVMILMTENTLSQLRDKLRHVDQAKYLVDLRVNGPEKVFKRKSLIDEAWNFPESENLRRNMSLKLEERDNYVQIKRAKSSSDQCNVIFLSNHQVFLNGNCTLCQITESNGPSLIKILFDTGASVSLVNSNLVDLKNVILDHAKLSVANGSNLKCLGKTVIKFNIQGVPFEQEVFVVDKIQFSDIILGIDFMTKNKIEINFANKQIIYKDLEKRNVILSANNSPCNGPIILNKPTENFTYQKIDNNLQSYCEAGHSKGSISRETDVKETKKGVKIGKEIGIVDVANSIRAVPLARGEKASGFQFKEVPGDLFTAQDEFSLVHCISKDFQGQGLAKEFRRKFGRVDLLRKIKINTGEFLFLKLPSNTFVFYLVVKERFFQKTDLQNVKSSLMNLKIFVQKYGINKLAMPKLGCGPRALKWDAVKNILINMFKDCDLEIKIFGCKPKVDENVEEDRVAQNVASCSSGQTQVQVDRKSRMVISDDDYLLLPKSESSIKVFSRFSGEGFFKANTHYLEVNNVFIEDQYVHNNDDMGFLSIINPTFYHKYVKKGDILGLYQITNENLGIINQIELNNDSSSREAEKIKRDNLDLNKPFRDLGGNINIY